MDDKNIELVVSGLAVTEEDQRAVLQLARELDRRWNQRDASAFADLFVDDGDFRIYTTAWLKSKAAIEDFWEKEVFPGLTDSMRHVITTKRVRFVTNDVAIGDGILCLVDSSEMQEQVLVEREGTLILVKRDARWYIAAARLATVAPK